MMISTAPLTSYRRYTKTTSTKAYTIYDFYKLAKQPHSQHVSCRH